MSIEPGTYKGTAVSALLTETKKGQAQIAITFEFHELGGKPQLTWYGGFSDKGFPVTMKALRSIGFNETDFTDLSGIIGLEASLVVDEEEYEGKVRTKIKWVNGPNAGPSLVAMDPAAAKKFSAQIKARIAAFDRSSGVKPAQKPKANGKAGGVISPEPPPIADEADDLPF